MKAKMAVWAVGFLLAGGPAVSFGKAIAVTAEGMAFHKAPENSVTVTVYPSVVPGTVLISQKIVVQGAPDMTTRCFYLVKGSADNARELVAALTPENVLQVSCQEGAAGR